MGQFILLSSAPSILLVYMLVKMAIEAPKLKRAEEAGKVSHKLWMFVWDELVNGSYRRYSKAQWQEVLELAKATDAEYAIAYPFVKAPRGATELVLRVISAMKVPPNKKPRTCRRFVHGKRRFR